MLILNGVSRLVKASGRQFGVLPEPFKVKGPYAPNGVASKHKRRP